MIKYFLEKLKSLGMTQLEIAAKSGINQSLICKLIQGGDCNTKTLVKIARAFNVSTDEVLGLDKPEPKPRDNTLHDSGNTRRAGAEERI